MSTVTDNSGYFSFEGKLLSDKTGLYRIHSKVDETGGVAQLADSDEVKNYHNFMFSNKDTIVFQKNNKNWFSSHTNTNPIDKQWRDFRSYTRQLRREFAAIEDNEVKKLSSLQYLYELKSYANTRDVHPLVTLVLITNVKEELLKTDVTEDQEFYYSLLDHLNAYYDNSSYAKQYEELLTDLFKTDTRLELDFFKNLVYGLGIACVLLLLVILYLLFRLKRVKIKHLQQASANLTNQEERVAELIIQEKSNKEIASELFISLSTVKTHIRNLYAKLEVNNRQEFVEKFKNQPRD